MKFKEIGVVLKLEFEVKIGRNAPNSHRRTGTYGPGGAVTLLPKKFTQCPKACVSVQTHSNRSKNKNVLISDF